ncbi:MAG: hypothetical protein EOO65_05510, partial [Methanosarcinales archaeon]
MNPWQAAVLRIVQANESTSDALLMRLYVPPSILSVTPNMMPIAGGLPVHLHTSDAAPLSNLACKFGGVGVVRAEYVSPTLVRCTAPAAYVPQTVDLTLSGNGVHWPPTSRVMIQYVENAVVLAVHPTVGAVAGGATVAVVGTGFQWQETYWCWFQRAADDAPIAVSDFSRAHYINSTLVQCAAPRQARPGQAVVRLSRHGPAERSIASLVASVTPLPTFEFVSMLTVTDMSPSAGPREGGTHIRITAPQVQGIVQLVCRLCNDDTHECVNFAAAVVEAALVTCTTPPLLQLVLAHEQVQLAAVQKQELYPLSLTLMAVNDAQFASPPVVFWVYEHANVTAVEPQYHVAHQVSAVHVRGSGFFSVFRGRAACRLSVEGTSEYDPYLHLLPADVEN